MLPVRISTPNPAGYAAFLRGALLAGFCVLLSACAHYQLGTGTQTKFATLFIAPVASKTVIPQAQALVTTQLREAFIRDGRVTLVDSPEAADAILALSLDRYERIVAVSRDDDAGLARRFDVSLLAHATLTDNRLKQPYFTDRPLIAKRGVFTDSGLVSAEYETLTLLAEQLASHAVHAALDVW